MSAAELVARLAQEGIDPSLLSEVAEALFTGEIETRKLANRRKHERERKAKSRDVTGQDVTSQEDTGPLIPEVSQTLPNPNPSNPPKGPPLILEAWREAARDSKLRDARGMPPDRSKALKARMKEYPEEEILQAIMIAKRSPFWNGENDRDWCGNFDTFLKPGKIGRLLEGVYGGIEQPKQIRPLTLEDLPGAIDFWRTQGNVERVRELEAQLEQARAA